MWMALCGLLGERPGNSYYEDSSVAADDEAAAEKTKKLAILLNYVEDVRARTDLLLMVLSMRVCARFHIGVTPIWLAVLAGSR